LVAKSEMKTIQNEFVERLNYSEPQIIDYKDLGFDFAFRIDPPLRQEVGRFQVIHAENIRNLSSEESTFYRNEVGFDECANLSFNYSNQEEFQEKNLEKFFCLKATNHTTLGGSYFSSEFQQLQLKIFACENSSESLVVCASEEEQQEYFIQASFEIVFVNQYFDYADLDDPVKGYLDDTYFYVLNRNQQIFTQLYLMHSEARLSQSLFPFVGPRVVSFLEHLPVIT